jgi:hypothetical protein
MSTHESGPTKILSPYRALFTGIYLDVFEFECDAEDVPNSLALQPCSPKVNIFDGQLTDQPPVRRKLKLRRGTYQRCIATSSHDRQTSTQIDKASPWPYSTQPPQVLTFTVYATNLLAQMCNVVANDQK